MIYIRGTQNGPGGKATIPFLLHDLRKGPRHCVSYKNVQQTNIIRAAMRVLCQTGAAEHRRKHNSYVLPVATPTIQETHVELLQEKATVEGRSLDERIPFGISEPDWKIVEVA